jgi:hypothetical protein
MIPDHQRGEKVVTGDHKVTALIETTARRCGRMGGEGKVETL